MSQTVPFQIVTGASIVPKAPFGQLYSHIKQRDPKLSETLDRLAAPQQLQSNLSNPLQALSFGLNNPSVGDTTPWAKVLSNVPTDMSQYFPLVLDASVNTPSSTDIELDVKVSHDLGFSFQTILVTPVIIPAGDIALPNLVITFADGAYFRNRDRVLMQFLSPSFDGSDIQLEVLLQ